MRIDIISDTVCPWCFIGKRRLEQAVNTKPPFEALEIAWQPYQLNPDMPAQGMEHHSYMSAKFGSPERAGRQFAVIERAGADQGIEFRFDRIEHIPNTVNSHRLIHYAGLNGDQDAVVEALFCAYFIEGRNIGDVTVLADIAAAAGLGGDAVGRYLESDQDTGYIVGEDRRIRALGVSGAPCFVIEGKYAVSGAQSAEIFHQIFDLVREERQPSPANIPEYSPLTG